MHVNVFYILSIFTFSLGLCLLLPNSQITNNLFVYAFSDTSQIKNLTDISEKADSLYDKGQYTEALKSNIVHISYIK